MTFDQDCDWVWELIFEDEEEEAEVVEENKLSPWWYTYEPPRSRHFTVQECHEALFESIGELLGEDVVELVQQLVFYSKEVIQREKQKYADLIEWIYSREDIIESLQRRVWNLWSMMESEDQRFRAAGPLDNVGPMVEIFNGHELRLKQVQIQLLQAQRELIEAHGQRPILQRWLTLQAVDFEAIDFA